MIRYLRLYAYFVRFSLSKAMEFRLDFFFRIIMDCIYYAVNIGFYFVIYQHTNLIGDWNLEQVYVFVGGFLVLDALMMTILSNNMWWIASFINKGDLDYYLVRPVSSLFFLSVREFALNSFMNLVMAAAFWVWAISNYSGTWTSVQLVVYIVLILNGTFLYYIVHMMSVIPVFWTQSSQGFMDLMHTLTSFMERPDRIFTGWVRKVLVTVFPFCLMASVPARIFFNGLDFEILAHVSLVTVGLFWLILVLWKAGLRVYSSASS